MTGTNEATAAKPAKQVLEGVMGHVDVQDATANKVRGHLKAKHLDTLTGQKLAKAQAATVAKELASILEGTEE